MADYLYKIEWKDYAGNDTSVSWFRKGVTAALTVYSFKASVPPLVTKWNGTDLHDIIKGSDITFKLLIKDSTDESHLLKLLDNTYYVSVVKEGTTRWYGQLFPRFFNQTYNTYPYEVTLTANDRLGMLKDESLHMIDYPEPGGFYKMGDILCKIFSSFNDGTTTYAHAPSELRVCTPLYYKTQDLLIDEIYLDPRVFMDETDQYSTKYEMIENMLAIFGMYLLQKKGIWYIIDPDAYTVDGVTLRYTYYSFASGSAVYGGISSENIVVDLFANKTDNKLVNKTAFKSYTAPVSKLIINENYQVKKMIFDVAANRSGNFYEGESGIELEFTTAGELRHWTFDGTTHGALTYVENDGWLKMQDLYTIPYNTNWYASKSLEVTTEHFSYLRFNASLFVEAPTEALKFQFRLKWVSEGDITGTINTFYLKNSIAGNEWEWSTSANSYGYYVRDAGGQASMTFDMPIPILSEKQKNIVLKIHIYPVNMLITEPHDQLYLIKNLQVQLVNSVMDSLNNKVTNEYTVGGDNVIKNEHTLNFKWGLGWNGSIVTGINYNPDIILSRIVDSSGTPDNIINSTQYPQAHVLILLKNKFIRYNQKPSPVINGEIRSADALTPLSLIQDYENAKYIIVSASHEDKDGIWNGKWRQMIDPVGDYNEDYNEDYYK